MKELNKNDIDILIDITKEIIKLRIKEFENTTNQEERELIQDEYKKILSIYDKLENIYKTF